MPTILLVNGWRAGADAELAGYLPAFRVYVDKHVGPAWGVAASLAFVPFAQRGAADRHAWWLVIRGHSDEPGALGYHDAHPNGLPFGRIFAGDDLRYGASLPVTITHELAEMLVDPDAAEVVQIGSRAWAKEAADAVEADELAIEVDGVACSNFVLPAYFQAESSGPWDYGKRLVGPVPHLTPGGYMSFYRNGQWHQVTARLADGSLSRRSQRPGRNARRASA